MTDRRRVDPARCFEDQRLSQPTGRDVTSIGSEQPAVEHLAILVVYFLSSQDDQAILELHCDRVQQHTQVPYTLYAATQRCSESTQAYISAQPNVVIVDLEPTTQRGSREHGHYLDGLLEAAMHGPASHICTLDVDSFPITDVWVATLANALDAASGLCGIFRAENGDTALAHPSCIFGTRAFFEQFKPTFAPMHASGTDARRFRRATGQSPDTGIDLVGKLWMARLGWGRVSRTNRVDPHYLMAGIYGDCVFHLGGLSRGKVFRRDLRRSLPHRLSRPLERVPNSPAWLGSVKKALLRRVRSGAVSRIAAQNRDVYVLLREWLLRDPDGLFAYLQGSGPTADDARAKELAKVNCTKRPR